ncbi:MAG: S8 family serine peptidase [Gammaproteobacteria bacterium]
MSHQCPFPVRSTDSRRCYRTGNASGFTLVLALIAGLSGYAGLSEAAPAAQAQRPAAPNAELPASAGGPVGWARGRLLVAPRAGLSEAEFAKALRPASARSKGRFARTHTHVIELPAGMDEVQSMQVLKRDRRLKYVELDMAVAPALSVNDPSYSSSWALPKIAAPAAWDIANGSGVTIAILDTGVNGTHPDLAANMVAGWNIYDNNADTTDVHGHGTMVSGAAAMTGNNAIGSAGVAWAAKIMPLRISAPDGWAYFSTIAQGINWAADNGARVANVSYAVSGSLAVQSAANYLRSKGGVVVAAAGNSGVEETVAAHDSMLSISATTSSDARASWSSFGNYVDLAAPGAGIYVTTRHGSYSSVSGTSFSAPITAGTVALMFAANPDLSPQDVDAILKGTAVDLGSAGYDTYFGYGRIDAARAVAQAAAMRTVTDTQAPAVRITAPTGGVVRGVVPVDLEYADNVGVTRVELYVNGNRVVSDDASPYAFAWDSKTVADGSHVLTVRAYDAAGNMGASAPVSVVAVNDTVAPVISSFNLADGMTVSPASQAVSASATDNQRVAKMSVAIDGRDFAITFGSSVSFNWNTRNLSKGAHNVTVRAWDHAGNTVSKSVTVYR